MIQTQDPKYFGMSNYLQLKDWSKTGIPSLLSIYEPLTSCKELEKSLETILRKVRYERKDERMTRHESMVPSAEAGGKKNE